MLQQLTDPDNLPFGVALALMLLLALVQLLGIGHGIGDTDIDHDLGTDVDAGLLSLAGLGRLPFLMWFMLILTVFGLVGLAGQQLLTTFTGSSLNGWIAAPIAALVAIPMTGILARPFAAILPRDETTAIPIDALVGREGEVTIGTASLGNPARVRVRDMHGLDHHVMAEPDSEGQSFTQGQHVLLVRREGDIFKAISRGDQLLPRLD